MMTTILDTTLTLAFIILFISLVLWLTYKFGRFQGEEAMADEMARLRQSRWQDDYRTGQEHGHQKGYNDGYTNGHAHGREQGYKDGRQDGYDDGRRYEAVTEHNREQLEKMIAQHDYNINQG